MKNGDSQTHRRLVFVYNAGSGIFDTLADVAHKAFSPQTYQCNLCALTHTSFRMRKSWKQFLETLDCPLEFLHADELKLRYDVQETPLPAVFRLEDGRLKLLIDAVEINACRTIDDLKHLVKSRLAQPSRTA